MDTDRWQRIQELFQAAIARGGRALDFPRRRLRGR
jgi:hypothetical protein